MTYLWGGGVPNSVRDYYSLRLRCYSHVLFLPILFFHHPLVLPWRQHPPYPLPPDHSSHNTTPTYPTPPPTAHLCPWGHWSTWTFPSSHYMAPILADSLVSPLVSPFSAMVVSPCLPHLACLATLDCPSQPLIHAPPNTPLLLHPGVNTADSAHQWYHTICDTIYQAMVSFVNGMRDHLTPPTKSGILLHHHP